MNGWEIFHVRVVPLSPLQLGTESGIGNYEQTNHVIPGAALRGAIAEAALAHCTQPDFLKAHGCCPDRAACPFWQLFNPEKEVLWGFGYPAKVGPAWPFPLTSRTCKQYAGYASGDGFIHHGVYDTLIGQFSYDLLTDPMFPLRDKLQPSLRGELAKLPSLLPVNCPTCGAPLKPSAGFYSWDGTQGQPMDAGQLLVRRATHVGINRARGVAEDGLLFTQEQIKAENGALTFHARLRAPVSQVTALRASLDGMEYYIGQGRSRGNGHVRLTLEDHCEVLLEQRLQQFKIAMSAGLSRIGTLVDARVTADLPGTLFSLTLRSPMILQTLGVSWTIPQPGHLGIPDAVLLRAWARPAIIGGWNSAAGLPRRTQLGVQAGSVFLYWTPRLVDDAELVSQLRALDIYGLGEERPRGYGEITVCAPFHVTNRLDLV